jgi:hypothetical protein
VDRLAHAVIVAEAEFGERSIDLVGERSGSSPSYSALVIRVSACRVSLTSHRPTSLKF